MAAQPAAIMVDYPANGSSFPPDITAPTFLWRDPIATNNQWQITVTFSDGSSALHFTSQGERLKIGAIDPRAVSASNRPPELTPQQAAAHTWTPDEASWSLIKQHSVKGAATIAITSGTAKGSVVIATSQDPVGAPIFYRDVPLMPSEVEKGVIKPLAPAAVPLIAWRLRDISQPQSRLMMEGLSTCANCHSFSSDGKTLGMDMDGPRNDKGMYALVKIEPEMSIRDQDVIEWSSFSGKLGSKIRVGFMSQVSPDGKYVSTMINGTDATKELESNYYVANFTNYNFLQVFFPTRGILAWYSRDTGKLQPLPGADDPDYVQTNAVWSPDGKYLVFARAKARPPYPAGGKPASYANDPNETQIQYDLYRIPFNNGKGGKPQPIAGASANGMSNSFPKISPDGRWIVFVKARNGLLMRPDSRLYIVPAEGGVAREMTCNTSLMNSWHSFSPNGRWMVFSSKSWSQYTRLFLTHIDENGNDSPPIIIDNTTAANRAVNIPEFLNIPPDGLTKILTPATDFYRLANSAWDLSVAGKTNEAIAMWNKAIELNPRSEKAHSNVGLLLAGAGRFEEAIPHFEKTLQINPLYPNAHSNLGVALISTGKQDAAIAEFEKAVVADPKSAEAHNNLGRILVMKGDLAQAIPHYQQSLDAVPGNDVVRENLAEAHNALAVAQVQKGQVDEAIEHFRRATTLKPDFKEAHFNLGDALFYLKKNPAAALTAWQAVLRLDPNHVPVLNQTAWLRATSPDASLRDGAAAVTLAERAATLGAVKQPAILDTLAAAYAEARRFQEAMQITTERLASARNQQNTRLTDELAARLALYQAGKPYRDQRR